MNVTVITPAWVKDRGADVPDWDNATEAVEEWKNIQPAYGATVGLAGAESAALGRQGVMTMLRGVGPPDTVLTAHCRAEIDGVTYEVVSVQAWDSITGALAHSEAVFSRLEG